MASFRKYGRRAAVRLLADHCDLYDAALQERRHAWPMRNLSVSYGDQSAQLKVIRAADPDGQGRHSFTAQQQTLRRLNAVVTAYFKRVRKADKGRQQAGSGENLRQRTVGYPRFKPRQRFDQVLFVAGDGAKWEPADGGRWTHASFQAIGRVKVGQHRPVVGRVKTLQLKREGRRWYVVVVREMEPVSLPTTGREIGVDVGVARFLTAGDSGGPSRKHGARSVTGGTSTTRPPAGGSIRAVTLPPRLSAPDGEWSS
jgi:putative transposase